MREVILDTETTGLDPASGHRMVEIGCVEMVDGRRTGGHFHSYFNPERDVPEEVVRVHGLTGAFLADKPLFSEKVDAFLEFIASDVLVIHNAAFDMKFVNAELARVGFAAIPMSRTLDTVPLARKKFPGAPASLDALCKRFDIDLTARTKHGALLDAELLADVYVELLGGKQSILAFSSRADAQTEANTERLLVMKREFPVDAEELEAHLAMVAGLKNALWS